jgi:FtsP/CotA-like multicopper oxidase with cupredoxin domain
MKKLTTILRTAVAASALGFISLAAHAATVSFHAHLKGPWEVPANTTTGTGVLSATLDTDTNVFTYHVEYKDLTGPAVAAHFHGPASQTETAGPQVSVKKPIASPIDGTETLTPEQAKDLLDNKWYFNIHTAANPGGEIRGQVLKNK